MALTIPTSTAAAFIAQQIITQINGTVERITKILQDGQPAANGFPALSGSDIVSAIGTVNFTKIQNAVTALS